MKRIFLLMIFVFYSQLSFAEEEVKELPPLDSAYMANHGMILMEKGSTIYVSNLTSYAKPSNVQLLYKLETKDLALLQTVRDGRLTTIKTSKFNLQRLMRGEKITITADVFNGHFKQGGMLVYKDMPLTFSKRLYARELTEIKESNKRQEFDVINLKKSYKIFVHRIQQAPSFAHILHIDVEAGCLAQFNTSSAVPKETELQYKFLNCGTMKPMYFETEAFQ
jgi:hypothetical protein